MGAKKFHSDTKRIGKKRPSSGEMIPEHAKVVVDTFVDRYQPKANIWENVETCYVCNSADKQSYLNRMGLNVVECLNCACYLDPRIKFEVAKDIYSDDKLLLIYI